MVDDALPYLSVAAIPHGLSDHIMHQRPNARFSHLPAVVEV